MQDLFGPTSMLFPIVLIFGVMYFLVLRPQQQRVKRLRLAVDSVRRGDTVITAGGLVGRVAKAPQKEDPELAVEIADGVTVKVVRSTVSEVRPKNQPANDKS